MQFCSQNSVIAVEMKFFYSLKIIMLPLITETEFRRLRTGRRTAAVKILLALAATTTVVFFITFMIYG